MNGSVSKFASTQTVRRVALVAILFLAGCGAATPVDSTGSPSASPAATPPVTREVGRDFTLSTLDGEPRTLSDYRGEWVVLNFWATWCPPCVEEMPYLSQIAADRDVQVFGVNFNEDESTVNEFVVNHEITFPILVDPDDITLLVYGVRGLPRTFVIAPDGTIAKTLIGQIDPAEFESWLDDHNVPHR